MMTIAVCSLVVLVAAGDQTRAQQPPLNLAQDTPAPPGQIVKAPRERLRITPNLRARYRDNVLGLPTSGPKGLHPCPASSVKPHNRDWVLPKAC